MFTKGYGLYHNSKYKLWNQKRKLEGGKKKLINMEKRKKRRWLEMDQSDFEVVTRTLRWGFLSLLLF